MRRKRYPGTVDMAGSLKGRESGVGSADFLTPDGVSGSQKVKEDPEWGEVTYECSLKEEVAKEDKKCIKKRKRSLHTKKEETKLKEEMETLAMREEERGNSAVEEALSVSLDSSKGEWRVKSECHFGCEGVESELPNANAIREPLNDECTDVFGGSGPFRRPVKPDSWDGNRPHAMRSTVNDGGTSLVPSLVGSQG